VVVSNREPYEHRWNDDGTEIIVHRPAGGVTSALDPLLQALRGVWIAWGSGDADDEVTDVDGRVGLPPEAPTYTLRRLWLDQRDIQQYYLGYSNQFLWPLCHLRPALTRVRRSHWERYQAVNRRFAEAVIEEIGGAPAAVWFQDYQLATAAAHVRSRRPDAALAHFWHIPWPPYEIFRIAPRAAELLEGLVANDLVGFHLASYADHFLDCAEKILGAAVDRDARTARHRGHTCHVGNFPISIDVDGFAALARRPGADEQLARIRNQYARGERQFGIGVDRMDYAKGLEEKLKALEILWNRYPDLREQFTFVQIAVPTRTDIDEYDYLNDRVERLTRTINERYGTDAWRPIHLLKSSYSAGRLALLYRAADLCLVSSLIDGMNLVAKEFVASQADDRGVLVLSRFAGAAEELDGAIEVNPYDPEDAAERIHQALHMEPAERRERLARLRATTRSIYDWMGDVFRRWAEVREQRIGRDERA
jgi:trehalose 6-phosphate synthase/phosphatase